MSVIGTISSGVVPNSDPCQIITLLVLVGLGLGVGEGLGLGNQIAISTRGVIIWQGVENGHNTGPRIWLVERNFNSIDKLLYLGGISLFVSLGLSVLFAFLVISLCIRAGDFSVTTIFLKVERHVSEWLNHSLNWFIQELCVAPLAPFRWRGKNTK